MSEIFMQFKQLLSGMGIVAVILLVVILLPLVVVLFTNKGTKRASLCFLCFFVGSSLLFFIVGVSVNVLYALCIKHLLVTYTSLSYDVCFVIAFILGFLVIPNPVYFLRKKNKKSFPAEKGKRQDKEALTGKTKQENGFVVSDEGKELLKKHGIN